MKKAFILFFTLCLILISQAVYSVASCVDSGNTGIPFNAPHFMAIAEF